MIELTEDQLLLLRENSIAQGKAIERHGEVLMEYDQRVQRGISFLQLCLGLNTIVLIFHIIINSI